MKIVLLVIGLLTVLPVKSEISIIVHPSNQNELANTDISRIFLGKMRYFPGGGPVIPINLASDVNARKKFEQLALKKSSSQVKAYWSKLVFTGKGTPPKEVGSSAEMLALIKANPSLIGYIPTSDLTEDVKVITMF